MRDDTAWRARIARVLGGALEVWGVAGSVGADPEDANGFVVVVSGLGGSVRLRHHALHGWIATLNDAASGTAVELGRHAGLPGLLRQLREALAPDAPAGRLVIGAQQILHAGEGAPR